MTMQHTIHTFRAASMEAAMDLVRQELGHDAVVVDAKEIASRRMLPWPSVRQEIEIRAERVERPATVNAVTALERKPAAKSRSVRTLAESMTRNRNVHNVA